MQQLTSKKCLVFFISLCSSLYTMENNFAVNLNNICGLLTIELAKNIDDQLYLTKVISKIPEQYLVSILTRPINFQGSSLMHLAAQKNKAKAINLLAEYMPSLIEALDEKKRTPLHIAALEKSVDAFEALWALNADRCQEDIYGYLALHYIFDLA